MKKYEKPIVMINEDLAEGVYAASGASACYTMKKPEINQTYANGRSYYVIKVHADHIDAGHPTNGQNVTIQFNQDVTVTKCGGTGGTLVSSSTGKVITIHYDYFNNSSDNFEFADLTVESEDGLEVERYYVDCDAD